MAKELLLKLPYRETRPHHRFSQIRPDHSSHLLPPEGDHRKREHTTETHTRKARVSQCKSVSSCYYRQVFKHSLTCSTQHRISCYSKQTGHYDSIIRIHILGSDSLDACTRGGLYCSAEPLPMGFTLPLTRLAFKRLRPLSCQRLGPPATLTTRVSLLYLRLTDPLEFRDAILT